MDVSDALLAFEALSQETRLTVFRVLVQAGPDGLPAGEAAVRVGVLQNTMSSHLHKLERAGLASSRRQGRQVIYRVNFDVVRDLILFLLQDCCGSSVEVSAPIVATLACAGEKP